MIVVSGHERAAVEHALAGRDVRFVHAEDHGRGMSASLRSGISAVGEDTDGAVVLLGDMPGVTAEHVDRLVAAFDPLADAAICVATDRGKRGHPVLWARQFFAEMMAIEGDVGARGLLRRYDNLIEEVEMDDRGVMLDIDRPEDLAALKGRVTTD